MKNHRHLSAWCHRGCHLVIVGFSVAAAFLLRFDFALPDDSALAIERAILLAMLVKLPVFEWLGLYRGLWRFAGLRDLYRLFFGNVVASALFALISSKLIGVSFSIWLIDALFCFLLTSLAHFSARIRAEAFPRDLSGQRRKGIIIYGAGAAGAELLHEIHANPSTHYSVKGFLDDDPLKKGALILGAPVLGSGRQVSAVVRSLNRHKLTAEEIIIAMPSATGPQMREALANCRAARIPCKMVPGIEELLSGKVLTDQLRNVSIHDLLGRPPVNLDDAPVKASILGRAVLITGAAGSIGSELCRQVARFEPACLVALDQSESDLFRIENELREKYPGLNLVTALGDIRDIDRLDEILQRHPVQSVFHAAAYKHVPMMESHLLEAVRNNVLGTWNVVCAAHRHNVRSLLMISSDKAVNPVCVMGVTKRVCERIVSAKRQGGVTKAASVRFGNVLGSSGSVVPIFQAQIAAGGPVKVTHPEARRYFMTVSEAVSLVMQASTKSQGAETFVLDMGEPIRIVELAENMIRLAGMAPYEEIDIQFTGLRPGERLIEAINGSNEDISVSTQEKIRIVRERPLTFEMITEWVEKLKELLSARGDSEITAHLKRLVPEYEPFTRGEHTARKVSARGAKQHVPLLAPDVQHIGDHAANGKCGEAALPELYVPPINSN